MDITFHCKCECSFTVGSARLSIAETIKCPNCLNVFRGKEELLQAIKFMETVVSMNTREMGFELIRKAGL